MKNSFIENNAEVVSAATLPWAKIYMEKGNTKFNDGWCFAIINGRLAEIHFDKKYGIYGHCYVQREEYDRIENKMINSDIKKYHFIYRKGYYIDKRRGVKQKAVDICKIYPEIRKYKY